MAQFLIRLSEMLHQKMKEKARELGKSVNALTVEFYENLVNSTSNVVRRRSDPAEDALWDFIVANRKLPNYAEAMEETGFSRQRVRDRFTHLLQSPGRAEALKTRLQRRVNAIVERRDFLRSEETSSEQQAELKVLEEEYDRLRLRQDAIHEIVEKLLEGRKEQEYRSKHEWTGDS